MELKTGIKHTLKITVTEDMTAAALGSGAVAVYSTPGMITMMENTCLECVRPYLGGDESTVGVSVNVSHLAATPVGMEVSFGCELVGIDRRKLIFNVYAYDETDKIGEGTHERFIIKPAEFLKRVNAKLKDKS